MLSAGPRCARVACQEDTVLLCMDLVYIVDRCLVRPAVLAPALDRVMSLCLIADPSSPRLCRCFTLLHLTECSLHRSALTSGGSKGDRSRQSYTRANQGQRKVPLPLLGTGFSAKVGLRVLYTGASLGQ